MSGTTHDLPLRTQRVTSQSSPIPPLTRRTFLAGAGAIAAGLAIDSTLIARHDLDFVQHTVQIARLPAAFHGFRIVQISDIHLDEFTEPLFLRFVIDHVNRLAPDLVLLTGDFASSGPLPLSVSRHAVAHCAEILQELRCPLRFACVGNHDNVIGHKFVVDALIANRIVPLINRHVALERRGDRLWLAGTDDPLTGLPDLDLAVPRAPRGPVLLMSHAPDYADRIVQHPRGPLVDLVFSGHSHGGQVRLPFVGALTLPPMGRKYVQGLFHLNTMQLYVNRGVGTTGLPFRFNCPPELTQLTLQPA